jgi:TolB protein
VALVSAVQIQGESFAENIMRLDLVQGSVNNLSGARLVADGSPAWSPDGDWIAFNRRLGQAPMGRQLVVMHSDGREVRQLTENAAVNHGPPRWSPDGRSLVYQRYRLDGTAAPAVWLIDVATGADHELAPDGIEPAWLP